MANVSTTRLALLRCVPAWARCTDKELANVAATVEEAEVGPGTVFTGEGTVDGDEYVIVEGWAAITVRGEPVAALGPGQLIGRAHLLELGRPDAIVIAKTDMRVLVVQGSDVEAGR